MTTRQPTPDIMADVRARTDDDSLDAMFGPASNGSTSVPLVLIDDNPFQERTEYGDITDLANDIREHGLLQPPIARQARGRYELAFGHRRKRACELVGMVVMPVVIREISDEQMATIAFSENEQRIDVTAIDKALAIQTMQTRFGWTQQQIADKLSIARPSVSNLLRLLRLPDEARHAVIAGAMSQRSADALVALLDVPQDIREESNLHRNAATRASAIVKDALAGVSADEIRQRTAWMLRQHATAIHEDPWYAVDFSGDVVAPLDVVAPICKGCQHALKRDSVVFCTGPVECRTNKATVFALNDLAEAAAEIGLPAVGLLLQSDYYTSMDDYSTRETLRRLLAGDGCPHGWLGLRWVAKRGQYSTAPYPAFPQAQTICHHGTGHKCRCLMADQRAKSAQGDGKTTASALKLILTRSVPILAAALLEIDEGLLRYVLANSISNSLRPSSTTLAWNRQELAEQVAERLVRNLVQEWKSVNDNRRDVTKMFTAAGLSDPFALASGIAAGDEATFPIL